MGYEPTFTGQPTAAGAEPEPEVPGRSNQYPGYNPFPVSTGMDIKKSIASGLNTTVHAPFGQFGDYRDMMKQLGDWVSKKTGGTDEQRAQIEARNPFPSLTNWIPSTADLKAADKTNIYDWKSQTWPGAIAQGAAGNLSGVVTGAPRSIAQAGADAFRFGLAPAVTSTVAEKAMHEFNPDYEQAAAMVGSRWGQKKATKLITPNPLQMEPESRAAYQDQVRQVRDERIPVSAGAVSDNRGLRYADSEMNPGLKNQMLEANTRAATRRISDGTEGGTHEVSVFRRGEGNANTLNGILNEVGGRFDRLAGRNTLHLDPQMNTDVNDMVNHYTRTPGAYSPDVIARVTAARDHIRDLMVLNGKHPQSGADHLTGEQYQRLRSDYSRAARDEANPQMSEALHDITHTLDSAMERSLNRPTMYGGNINDAGEFPQARRDYRNALVVEDAVKASSLEGSGGHITPAALESAAAKVMGRRQHERGFDDFSYAPAAKRVLYGMPDSGTSPREQFHKAIENMAGVPLGIAGWIAGGAGGHAAGGLASEGALAGMLGAQHMATPMVAKYLQNTAAGYLATPLGQAHLGNQLLTDANAPGLGSIPGLLATTEAARRPKKSHDIEGLLPGPPPEEKIPTLRGRGGRNLNLVE